MLEITNLAILSEVASVLSRVIVLGVLALVVVMCSLRMQVAHTLGILILASACAAQPQQTEQPWQQFVQVRGQESVPAEWVSTSEGAFAHSIRIPNTSATDANPRPGMTSHQYFEHLCKNEAGEFIYKTVGQVDGLYQMRPMKRVRDQELRSRFAIEHPEFAVAIYMGPPETLLVRTSRYQFFETAQNDWSRKYGVEGSLLRFSGYNELTDKGMTVVAIPAPASRYGFTWRGIRRKLDRENGIAGGELIVLDLKTNEVLAVRRAFLRSEGVRGVPEGVWWLQAQMCPNFKRDQYSDLRQQQYNFLSAVLKPPISSR